MAQTLDVPVLFTLGNSLKPKVCYQNRFSDKFVSHVIKLTGTTG